MVDIFRKSLLNQSLQNLRGFWRELVPDSWQGGSDEFDPDLSDKDRELLRECIEDCLSARGGVVSARLRAAELGKRYLGLTSVGRDRFLQLLATEFGVDHNQVTELVNIYQAADTENLDKAGVSLREALIAPRVKLLTHFNDLPEGVKFLGDMRADLLKIRNQSEQLKAFDSDFKQLLCSWFDVGFLRLKRIDWLSPAALLEKLIAYEAVHEIESWQDLRNRLDADRCCYAFFHPHMPDEPLIFVEVALVSGIATNIQQLLETTAPAQDPETADTAIFYSISNTQPGLRGISFGDFLIKRVVDDLRQHYPKLKQFVTLSPIPGFRKWLATQPANTTLALLADKERTALAGLLERGESNRLADLLATPDWHLKPEIMETIQAPLQSLCLHYLLHEKQRNAPLDPVARFHLGNGAKIEQLNWMANTAPVGFAQSAGMMVNYGYRPGEIEKNHELFADSGKISVSSAIGRQLGKSLR